MTKKVAIFGSTGSIGTQALDIIYSNPDEYELVALVANRSFDQMYEQCTRFNPTYASLADERMREKLRLMPLAQTKVVHPHYDEIIAASEADIVINGLMGAAGLSVTRAALSQGRRLGLANKESLIMAGDLVTKLASTKGAELIPVDSEHSAIFQCLLGEKREEVSRFWITASGGPFRGKSRSDLESITVEQALAHPTWTMGSKISIDSSTLMNKGLEVIEAHFLFDAEYDDIEVVVHPQSIIHSMVEYCDGSVKAHLGVTDMRIPIQYALTYPLRGNSPLEPLDFRDIGELTFEAPDLETFKCLQYAYEAGRVGGTAPAILNAANEVAVAAFLNREIGYLDIGRLVSEALSYFDHESQSSFEQVLEVDEKTRQFAQSYIAKYLRL